MAHREKTRAKADGQENFADAPRLVGDCEDLLPFAWRTPPDLQDRRPSKVLRDMEQARQLRTAPPNASSRRV